MVLVTAALGCSRVRGSAVRTSSAPAGKTNDVRVVALHLPDDAHEVGLIEATGTGDLPELVAEFRAQAAKVGGTIAKVDRMHTKFHTQQVTRTESYNCGTPQSPRTCTRNVTSTQEVATTTIHGRAFVVKP